MSYTDEEAMRPQLAACAMAGLLRRREADGSFSYDVTGLAAPGDPTRLATDSLAVADALMAEARNTPSP